MANWFHKFFNPHCPHCREERESSRHCDSCDILRMEVERLLIENNKLLDRILTPAKEEPIEFTNNKAALPRAVPWHIRRQMLEAEDREKAKLLRNAPKTDTDLLELEKEVLNAESEREHGNSNRAV